MSIDFPSAIEKDQKPTHAKDSSTSDESSRNSSASGSTTTSANNSDDSSQTTTTNPDSTSSINHNKDPSPAFPLANPRKHRSTGILTLNRSSSSPRLRSGSTSTSSNVPIEPVPALPLKIEIQPPKSILTTSASCTSFTNSPASFSPRVHSLPRVPSVQFAPLPQLAPRKRKSAVPLGIAARSVMMQRRRQIMYGTSAAATFEDDEPALVEGIPSDPEGSGMWTSEEAKEHLTRQIRLKEKEREKKLKKQQKELERDAAKGDNAPVEEDDPLVIFGRMMKDAWRKVGKRDKSKAKAPDPQIMTQAEAEVDSIIQSTLTISPSSISGMEWMKDEESTSKGTPDDNTNDTNGSADLEEESLVEDEDENDTGIDPNEVDVSKIVPRSGSPPPSAPLFQRTDSYQSQQSETSTADIDANADADTHPIADADSSTTTTIITINPPSPTTPASSTTEYHTPTSTNFATTESPNSTQFQTTTPEQTSYKSVKDASVVMNPDTKVQLPSLDLTPMSPIEF